MYDHVPEDMNAAYRAGLGNTRWCIRSAAVDYFSQAEGCIVSQLSFCLCLNESDSPLWGSFLFIFNRVLKFDS